MKLRRVKARGGTTRAKGNLQRRSVQPSQRSRVALALSTANCANQRRVVFLNLRLSSKSGCRNVPRGREV
eukprot:495193-Pleurochrysis_carterae.AAC.1